MKNTPRYLFVNKEGEIFEHCEDVKEMLAISFSLNNQKLLYTMYEKSSKKTF